GLIRHIPLRLAPEVQGIITPVGIPGQNGGPDSSGFFDGSAESVPAAICVPAGVEIYQIIVVIHFLLLLFLGRHEGAGQIVDVSKLNLALEIPSIGIDSGGYVSAVFAVLTPVAGGNSVVPAA